MTESGQSSRGGDAARRDLPRPESQATLSAIGDVSVAAADAVGRVAASSRKTGWLPVFGFLLLTYVAGCWAAISAHLSPPWVEAFVAPLLLALVATLAFWRRQVWKRRARDWQQKEFAQRDKSNSLAHTTANGVNAIRAHLAGIGRADSPCAAAEHMNQIAQALTRIDSALSKTAEEVPNDADPGGENWKATRNSKAA